MQVKLSNWQSSVWKDKNRYKVINCGRRSGKTFLTVSKIIDFCSNNADSIVWYIAPTYKQAKQIAWQMLGEFVPKWSVEKKNETELKIVFKNGSQIYLKGAEDPDKLRGVRIDLCVFDECAFINRWDEVWKVIRPTLADSRADVWFISTPNGFNHFYDLSQCKNDEWQYFHFTSYDNPHIDRHEISSARKDMERNEFDQEWMGKFVKMSGMVYYEWDAERQFVPLKYTEALPLHTTFDFGVNDPTSIIWLQPNGSETRVVDYYEASNADIHHFIQVLNSKPYKTPDLCTGDISGRARELTTGKSPIDVLRKNGYYLRTSNIPNIKEQIRQAHLKIKNLYVSDELTRFRDCLINYRYPEKRSNLINQQNEIPIHDEYSHAMRAFEYWAWNTSDKFENLKKEIKPGTGAELMEFVKMNRKINKWV